MTSEAQFITYAVMGSWVSHPIARRGKEPRPPRLQDDTEMLASWVSEAIHLFKRAGLCLDSALKIGGKAQMPGNILNILDGFLGEGYDTKHIEEIRDIYLRLGRCLERVNIDRQHTLLFRFGERLIEKKDSKPEAQVCPVSLQRINGRFNPNYGEEYFSKDRKFYLRRYPLNPEPVAETYPNRRTELSTQKNITSSGMNWNDIRLSPRPWERFSQEERRMMPGTLDDWRVKLNAPDWSLESLGTHNLDYFRYLGVKVVMHEIIHSIAMETPRYKHGQAYHYDPRKNEWNLIDANGIPLCLQLAKEKGIDSTLQNPDTYAWLAMFLSMPWYIWWDSDAIRTKSYKDWKETDWGCPRPNIYNDRLAKRQLQYRPAKEWLAAEGRPPMNQKDMDQECIGRGPYCFLPTPGNS